MSESAVFAMALSGMREISRVTAGRLLNEFKTYDTLLRDPFEDVQNRLPGIRGANRIVRILRDEDAMRARLTAASEHLSRLNQRRIHVISPLDSAWPARVNVLPLAKRPYLFYAYGAIKLMQTQVIAIFGARNMDPDLIERARLLAARLTSDGCTLATGLVHEFDLEMHRLPRPSVLVASSGFSRIPKNMRAVISQVTRAGGTLVGTFPLDYGPFDHDDRTRAVLQAALASVSVFFVPVKPTPEWGSLEWLHEANRSAIVIGSADNYSMLNVKVLPPDTSPGNIAATVLAHI